MPARFRKKVRKQRGSHTHGWGCKKKHRGGGSRGGRGMANLMIRKRTLQFKEYPGHFGHKGFKIHASIQRVGEVRAITLRAVDVMAARSGKNEIDLGELGYHKLLGTGKATRKLHIKVGIATESAKAKVAAAGGKVTSPEVEENEA